MDQSAYIMELQRLLDSVPSSSKKQFLHIYLTQSKSPLLAIGLDVCLGCLGVDRFYAGDIGLGIVKLLTLGGLGVWVFVDLFLIGGRIYEKNLERGYETRNIMLANPTSYPK